MELSIIIPSRNEMFLKDTIEDIIKNKEADTEVIALLDGAWAKPPVPKYDNVNVIYVSKAIGQRAGANLACRLSRAKYIMKIDAHCSFDKGFDRKMLEAFAVTGDNVTMVPTMRNLWSFDWKCMKCGKKWYQSPTPVNCKEENFKGTGKPCDSTKFKRKMMWVGKERPQSNSYCFDAEPHFQYNGQYTKTEEYKNGAIVGYKLSFDEPSLSPSVIGLLANFANSHHLPSGTYSFWGGENMTMDTMRFSLINDGGGVGIVEILPIGDKSQVDGVATSPVLTDVINDRDVSSSTAGNGANKPSVSNTVCELFLSEISTPTITPFINSPNPVPTTRRIINSNLIKELNDILGGEFVYSEKTSSFHNGSVALRTVHDKGITETMSLQGSCFMSTREKYWEWDLGGEELGNWGNQGMQVACATWLCGGKVLVNHNTWYAHMFRTQGGDFGFPWQVSGRDNKKTKDNVKNLFYYKKHPKQIYPVSWLVEKFWPVTGWTQEKLDELKKIESS